MKKNTLIAAAALLALAGSAFAQQTQPASAPKTRAEVYAELVRAKADGSYDKLHREYADPAADFVSTKTRAEVVAELRQAQADGSYARMHREYVSPVEDMHPSTKTRQEVAAELKQARQDGSLDKAYREYYFN